MLLEPLSAVCRFPPIRASFTPVSVLEYVESLLLYVFRRFEKLVDLIELYFLTFS